MTNPSFSSVCRLLLACLLPLAGRSAAAAPNETNRRVTDLEARFERLRSHADLLGFRHNAAIAPRAMGGPDRTDTHYQGIARSTVAGRPYLFVSRAGMFFGDRGYLLIVKMGSRNPLGERMRCNRYEKSDSIEGTQPPEEDRVVSSLVFTDYHHAGGIQLCGDILAVPLEGTPWVSTPEGKVVFFDVSDPESPKLLPAEITSTSKIGIVGLTKLPDGRFLLVTTGGDGGTLKFYRSNSSSFYDPNFAFAFHDAFDVDDVLDGTWEKGKTSHQSLQLMVQRSETGVETVYLVAGRNDRDTTPFISGKDLLYLYKVTGWQAGSHIGIREISHRHLHTDSGNAANNELAGQADQPSSYHTDSNGNFLAGLSTYLSPTGELLVYAVEHYNWGPRGSVRFAEFRDEQVYRESNPIYDKQLVLHAPEFITEDATAVLDAGDSLRVGEGLRPWVEIFEDANYNGRSVIMDWPDREKEDFQDLRQLSWPTGFNDKASSVRWYAPPGWRIRLYDGDNYQVSDEEPYLDLPGLGGPMGIPVLSESPNEFDNDFVDSTGIHETRVTSMKFIPPGYPVGTVLTGNPLLPPEDPGTEEVDDGWSRPKEHLTYNWRLLDENGDPVSSEWATLTPVPGSPWQATLRTFSKGVETLNAELTLGPIPVQRVVRPIRFLKLNRVPVVDASVQSTVNGRVTLAVNVKDDDAGDKVDLLVTWNGHPLVERFRGGNGQRSFTISHDFTNPDPERQYRSTVSIRIQAVDTASAVSEPVEERSIVQWRSNLAPVAGPETFHRAILSGFKTRIDTLLANDSEPDGDYFAFTGVTSVFPEGATVTEENGWLLYEPPAGFGHLPGGFDYAVRDQFGAFTIARVSILPEDSTAPGLNLVSVRSRDGGGVVVEFQGIPGRNYEVFAASSVTGPWSSLGRVTASPIGRIRIDDPAAGAGRFYRTQLLAF